MAYSVGHTLELAAIKSIALMPVTIVLCVIYVGVFDRLIYM